eukprot:426367-Pyramimonas_sp.AAC.1
MAQQAPARPPRWPKMHPRGPPGRPQDAPIIDCPTVFEEFQVWLSFSLSTAPDGPRCLQGRPKIAPQASKMAV